MNFNPRVSLTIFGNQISALTNKEQSDLEKLQHYLDCLLYFILSVCYFCNNVSVFSCLSSPFYPIELKGHQASSYILRPAISRHYRVIDPTWQ